MIGFTEEQLKVTIMELFDKSRKPITPEVASVIEHALEGVAQVIYWNNQAIEQELERTYVRKDSVPRSS